jgi:hypothetical protein
MKRHRGFVAAGLAGVLLAGCGSGDGDDSAAGSEASSSPSASASGSPSATATPTPTIQPATGQLVERPTFRFHVPQGWEVDYDGMDGWDVLSPDPLERSTISVFYFEDTVQGLPEVEYGWLESMRRQARVARIVDRTEIEGQHAFRIQGTQDDRATESVGAVVNGNELTLTFHIDAGPAKARQIIDSVTASIEWS